MTKKERREIKDEAINVKAHACIGCGLKGEIKATLSSNSLQKNVAGTAVVVDCVATNGAKPVPACDKDSFKECKRYIDFYSAYSEEEVVIEGLIIPKS